MSTMNYTPEITQKLINDFSILKKSVEDLCAELKVPRRSIIAKLSSLGLYTKPAYKNKLGEIPVKKSHYVEKISGILGITAEQAECLEKVNKHVLVLLVKGLERP